MVHGLLLVLALLSLSPDKVEYRPTLLIQLGVTDLDRAIAFYTGVLGFELNERRDDLRFAHLATNVAGLEIGLSEQPAPKGSGSALLNIGVADVAAARRALEAKGVVFRRPTVAPGTSKSQLHDARRAVKLTLSSDRARVTMHERG